MGRKVQYEPMTGQILLLESMDEAIEGLYVEKDIENPPLHAIRRYLDGIEVRWDRWDGERWQRIGGFGNSMHTDRFVTEGYANKLTGMYHRTDSGTEERLLGPALTKEATTVLGMGQNVLTFAATELKYLKVAKVPVRVPVQASIDEEVLTDVLLFKSAPEIDSKTIEISLHIKTYEAYKEGETPDGREEPIAIRAVHYNDERRRDQDVVWNSSTMASYLIKEAILVSSDGESPTTLVLPTPYWTAPENTVYVTIMAEKPITFYGTTIEDSFVPYMSVVRHPLEVKELDSPTSLDNIFITNITSEGNVGITTSAPPNHGVVERVSLSSNNCRVFVEWDRSASYIGMATVNESPVQLTTKTGSTCFGYADISGDYTEIVAAYGDGQHVVTVETLEKPEFTAVFTKIYPGEQTALKAGDVMGLEITTTSTIKAAEIWGQAWKNETLAIPNQTGTFIIPITAGTPIPDGLHWIPLRIQNTAGTWSEMFEDETNEVVVDNRAPIIHIDTGVYPAGQRALKGEESYTYPNAFTAEFTTDVVASSSSNLQIIDDFGGVTRVSGDYETGTYTLTLTNGVNGLVTVFNQEVRIANVPVALSNNTPVQVRSGVGAVNLPCSFNQDLLVDVDTPTITAIDSDTHSLDILSHELEVTNLAGIATTLNRSYFIKGFARKVLTINHPASSINIGVGIVNVQDVVASGQVNFSPPYPLFENRVANIADIEFVGDYHCEGQVVTFSAAQAQEFDYSPTANITLNIEEI